MQSSAHASAHSMRFAEFARIRNSRKMFIYMRMLPQCNHVVKIVVRIILEIISELVYFMNFTFTYICAYGVARFWILYTLKFISYMYIFCIDTFFHFFFAILFNLFFHQRKFIWLGIEIFKPNPQHHQSKWCQWVTHQYWTRKFNTMVIVYF